MDALSTTEQDGTNHMHWWKIPYSIPHSRAEGKIGLNFFIIKRPPTCTLGLSLLLSSLFFLVDFLLVLEGDLVSVSGLPPCSCFLAPSGVDKIGKNLKVAEIQER